MTYIKVIKVILFLLGYSLAATFSPNCEEIELLSQYPELASVTYDASIQSVSFTNARFGSKVEGERSDAFTHALWNVLITARVYGLDSRWDVSTLEAATTWARAFTDAHECVSLRECCPSNPERFKQMDLHNNLVGRKFVIEVGLPIKTDSEYVALMYDKVMNQSMWFNSNPVQGIDHIARSTRCYSDKTPIILSPNPSGFDLFESDNCDLAATVLPFNLNMKSINQSHTLHISSDEDWFQLCTGGELLSLRVHSSCTGLNVSAVDIDGNEVFSQSIGVASSSMLQIPSLSGTYFIKVSGNSSSSCNYNIEFYLELQQNRSCEPSGITSGSVTSGGSTGNVLPPCNYPICTPSSFGSLPFGPVQSSTLAISLDRNDFQQIIFTVDTIDVNRTSTGSYDISLVQWAELDEFTNEQKCATFMSPLFNEQIVHQRIPVGDDFGENVNVRTTVLNCANIEIDNMLYDTPTSISYAGDIIIIPGTSHKVSFNLTNWPFTKVGNRLQFDALIQTNINLTDQEFVVDNASPPNIIKMIARSSDGRIFEWSFIPKAIADGQVVPIRIMVVPIDLNGTSLSAYLRFQVPYFSQYLYYDPKFSVLLDTGAGNTEEEEDKKKEEKENVDTMIIASIGGAVVVIIVIVIASTILWKRRSKRLQMRLRKRVQLSPSTY